MEIVGEEVEALRRLVQEFSDFARLPRVQPVETALRPYLEELLRTNPQFETHLTEPQWLVAGPVRAAVDPLLMRRVLINLLQNACDAVREAGAPPEGSVTLRLCVTGAEALIEVEDRGEGVPEANLARLFDPYFTTKDDGTGLGLAIVKKIIIEHGGDIEVASPPPHQAQGALFTVRLPLLEAQAEQGPALTQEDEAS
jgi:signal transduction histidine kinase